MSQNRILFESLAACARGVAFIARPLSSWWARTQVYDELMSMDDRLLADIGISRADIPAIAASPRVAAPRVAADQVHRLWRPEIPVANNDGVTPRVE